MFVSTIRPEILAGGQVMRRNLFVLSVLTCAVIVAGVAVAEEVTFPYFGFHNPLKRM